MATRIRRSGEPIGGEVEGRRWKGWQKVKCVEILFGETGRGESGAGEGECVDCFFRRGWGVAGKWWEIFVIGL